MSRPILVFVIGLLGIGLFFGGNRALGEDEDATATSSWDLGLRTGATFGSIVNGSNTHFDFGGFPIAVDFNQNLSAKWTLQIQGHMVFDITNFEVTRTGLAATGAYHLLGGSRNLARDYGPDKVIFTNPYNFSLLLRAGLQRYDASAKTGGPSLTGSALEVAGGIEYRFDTSESNAISIDLLTTLLSLPASQERLSVHTTEITFAWRFFI